jgi:hypothetical protein
MQLLCLWTVTSVLFYCKYAVSGRLPSGTTPQQSEGQGSTLGFLVCKQQPSLIQTQTFSVLNTHPDGNNAHNMTVIHQQSVHCGVLQLHQPHVIYDAATTVLQRIHAQQNLSSVAAVDVAEALKHTTQITSRCVCAQHNAYKGKRPL